MINITRTHGTSHGEINIDVIYSYSQHMIDLSEIDSTLTQLHFDHQNDTDPILTRCQLDIGPTSGIV